MKSRKRPAAAVPTRLEVELAGDRRLAEDVIVELRALAERYGLQVPSATVVTRPVTPRKTRKTPRRPTRTRRS